MFGRKFRLPADILFGNLSEHEFQSIAEFQDNLAAMYECAYESIGHCQSEMKKHYDKKRKSEPLTIGDYVYIFNPRIRSNELKSKWNGPFEITETKNHVFKANDHWHPRDRLRKCHDDIKIDQLSSSDDDTSDEDSHEDVIADDEIDDDNGVPQRYNLRPRPTRQVDRLMVSKIKLL